MKKIRHLGIWMDHSKAFIMELLNDKIVQSSVISDSVNEVKEDRFDRHEKLLHNKEQHIQSTYYKKLGEIIANFQEVILFGPTDAKNELVNLLRTDHMFENVRIEILHSDKMTENQMHAFVREFFR